MRLNEPERAPLSFQSDPQIGRGGDAPVGLQLPGHCREHALGCFAQAAMHELLHAIGDRAD